MADNTEVTFLIGKAEKGDPSAQLTLAGMYEKGYGVARDMGLAAQWYMQAASQGSPEAQARMKEAGAPPFVSGNDFGSLDETILTEQFDRPVMVTHWPADIKAFYMQPDPEDPGKALCVDVLAPEGYGEIIGGSQRIHDHDLLLRRIQEHGLPLEAFQWYLEIRKYGTVPHSGFGMGIERCVTWICGISHLREAIPYPRQIHRIYP